MVRSGARRWTRVCLAAFLMVGFALGLAALNAKPAYAAGDQIDSFKISYSVATSGVLSVEETIVWRFGDDSGRHGIDRDLVTREPYDDDNDQVYSIDNIDVSSPSGAPDQFTTTTNEDDRNAQLRIRIGDPNQTVDSATATYVIKYDVTGAMRTSGSYDEFFWDAPGFENPLIEDLSITATVPGGAQQVSCFFGPVKSTNPCQTASDAGGVATFAQSNVPAGQSLSFGVKIKSGLVSDNSPHLEPNAAKLTTREKVLIGAGVGLGVLVAAGSPIVGVLWWRKNGRDRRYTNLAPGTLPLPGTPVEVGYHDPDMPIPVSFSPPRIPVAEAGVLVDGQVDPRDTAATIIDLAVRGALTVESTSDDDFRVTLVDPNRAQAPHEMILMTKIFSGRSPGAVEDLSARGSMFAAHTAMVAAVRGQVAERGWFRSVPTARKAGGFGFGGVVVIGFVLFQIGAAALWLLLPLLPILITVLVIRHKLRRGQRTADGRAICDQVEGFKTYLATAEAEQLQFEEGEDIFSKYLPWAIAFDLADRWAKICGDLVRMGRLPDQVPYWYVGNYHMAAFNTGFLASTLTTAATPMPSSGSGGSGFGGGSSFSGGGFSGGGGGGGGSSSW